MLNKGGGGGGFFRGWSRLHGGEWGLGEKVGYGVDKDIGITVS